jgi:hypothetical protein
MKRKINVILAAFFFASMLVLTFTARDIRNSMLPNVEVRRLTQEEFEFTYIFMEQEYTSTQSRLAIPKKLYNSGDVYVLTTVQINGEPRDAVRRAFPQVGAESGDFYEVTGGINGNAFVVMESNRVLTDGAEVLIVS